MRSDQTPDKLNNRVHRHYTEWFVGTGAQTEFRLQRTYTSIEDIDVFVAGALMRPADRGTAYNYSVRGITSGYAGEKNAINFAVAPALNANIAVRIVST